MYTTIWNSVNYLHLGIVVHYKTVNNDKYWVYILIVIPVFKWMPPYWDNKALLPYPIFIFNF